jgi:hypothetical protein
MYETLSMLGREHAADLEREAARSRLAAAARSKQRIASHRAHSASRQTKEARMRFSTFLIRFRRLLLLGAVVVGVAVPTAGAVVRPPDVQDAASSIAGTVVGTPPDVQDAAAGLHSAPTGITADALRPDDRSGPLGIGESSFVSVSGGAAFDWGDWAIGLGVGFGAALALVGGVLLTRRVPRRIGAAATR